MKNNPQILVIGEHRPREVIEPLQESSLSFDVIIPDGSYQDPRKYFSFLIRCWRTTRDDEIKLILINGFDPFSLLAAVTGKLQGVPVIVRVAGPPHQVKRAKLRESITDWQLLSWLTHGLHLALTKVILRLVDSSISVSENVQRDLVNNSSLTEHDISVVPVPIRVEDTNPPRQNRNVPNIDTSQIILTTTNLKYKRKYEGVREMTPAILEYLSRNPDTSWVVAGGGKYLNDLRSFLLDCARKEGVEERIYLPGFVTDISSLYEAADVFVYWSHVDGYPNVVLEAQAHQLPVITNPDFGMKDQIEHGESGLHVKLGEVESLADAIESVFADPKFAASLGEGGYQRVSSENNPQVIGQAFKRIIEESVVEHSSDRKVIPE